MTRLSRSGPSGSPFEVADIRFWISDLKNPWLKASIELVNKCNKIPEDDVISRAGQPNPSPVIIDIRLAMRDPKKPLGKVLNRVGK